MKKEDIKKINLPIEDISREEYKDSEILMYDEFQTY